MSQACFHCSEPVPDGVRASVRYDGIERPVCCIGCESVASLIIDAGNGDYYRHRDGSAPFAGIAVEPASTPARDIAARYARFDKPINQHGFVSVRGDGTTEAQLLVDGIYCAACSWLIERSIGALDGVCEVTVNPVTRHAGIAWRTGSQTPGTIFTAIARLGYRPHPLLRAEAQAAASAERRSALKRLAVAGLGMMQVMTFAIALYAGAFSGIEIRFERFFLAVSLLVATPVVFYSAQPFFTAAWRGLRARAPGMDVPVALAIGGAYAASVVTTLTGDAQRAVYFDSVVMFTFFLSVGRYLEMQARHRTGAATEALARLAPTTATVLRPNAQGLPGELLVPIDDLVVDDLVRVRAGEPVPADGCVVSGRTSVDESLLSGEAKPRPKHAGDAVTGGSLNIGGPFDMRVEATGQATTLAQITRLLQRAQQQRPRIALVADRMAARFVVIVLLSALGIGLAWWHIDPNRAFSVTLSVLVVTCPCALSLATPAALTAATGALARIGLLVTRGHALETLAAADRVVFDKTGTLTQGAFTITAIETCSSLDAAGCMDLAAALERHSEHPLAAAFALHASGTAATDVRVVPGAGIEGDIAGRGYRLGTQAFAGHWVAGTALPQHDDGTEIWLASATEALARLSLTDRLRPDAATVVEALSALGIVASMASGDGEPAVRAVAQRAGVHDWRAAQSPADKLALIRALQADGHRVAMVGDGLNDAPVLAGADVSVALGSGTALAQSSADIVLLGTTLTPLVTGVRHARRTMRVIRQNLGWAIGYNLVALPLAASGTLLPWMAAIGMSLSSLLVVVNALRLTRIEPLLATTVPPTVAVNRQTAPTRSVA